MSATKKKGPIDDKPKQENSEKSKEEEILELAKKELMRDVKCASIRANQFGAHSWAKPQNYVPSKRFLRHMLMNASKDNERRNKKQEDLKRKEKHRSKGLSSNRHNSYDKEKTVSKKRQASIDDDLTHTRNKHKRS